MSSIDMSVNLWSTGPIFDQEKEMDKSVPRILSEFREHHGAVNCLKWSHDGLYVSCYQSVVGLIVPL